MEIVAHRGLHTPAPENSLGAVQAALHAGTHYIEVDVRAARDGALFLLHDARVDRTTDGAGRLGQMLASDVRAFRLADGSPVPRFEEALDLCRGRAVLCVDVKEPAIGQQIVSAVCEAGVDAEIWSSHEEVVARAADAGLVSALIALGIMPRGGVRELIELGRQLGAQALSFFPADLEPRVIRSCRELGMAFMCGTPNDLPTWQHLAASEARAIITDDPVRCAEIVRTGRSSRGMAAEMS